MDAVGEALRQLIVIDGHPVIPLAQTSDERRFLIGDYEAVLSGVFLTVCLHGRDAVKELRYQYYRAKQRSQDPGQGVPSPTP
jgi:hypothetical protein